MTKDARPTGIEAGAMLIHWFVGRDSYLEAEMSILDNWPTEGQLLIVCECWVSLHHLQDHRVDR